MVLNAEERWANLTSLSDIRNTRGGLGPGFLWNRLLLCRQPPCAILSITSSPVTLLRSGKVAALYQTLPLYKGKSQEVEAQPASPFDGITLSSKEVLKKSKAAVPCTYGVKWPAGMSAGQIRSALARRLVGYKLLHEPTHSPQNLWAYSQSPNLQ